MTIAEKLDQMYPAKCLACQTPIKRTDAKWHDHASRIFCPKCGMDQTSAEAGSIRRYRPIEYSIASELDADEYDAEFKRQSVVKISEADMRGVFGHKCEQPTCPICNPDMNLTELAELYERAATPPHSCKVCGVKESEHSLASELHQFES